MCFRSGIRGKIVSQSVQFPSRNRLLSAFEAADFELLRPHLEAAPFNKDLVLETCNEPIEHVYFPNSGIGSIVAQTHSGDQVEAGIFGCEGMSGMAIVMGTDRSPLTSIVQVAGDAHRITAAALRQVIEQSPRMHALLLRYGQVMAVQTAFTALSNVIHPLEVRLARWLLMAHDRVEGDELALTHDYLSIMLAVRRPSVTTALHILEGNLFIKATRGLVTIRDREALEEFADGSYGKPEAEYGRLISTKAI